MNASKLKIGMLLGLLIVSSLAIFFPSDHQISFNKLYQTGDLVADIRVKRKSSDFQGALVAAYLSAIVSGTGLAVVGMASPEFIRLAKFLRAWKGKAGAVFFSVGMMVIPVGLLFLEVEPRPTSSSGMVFLASGKSRFFLAIWTAGIFLFYFLAFEMFLASLVGLFLRNGRESE